MHEKTRALLEAADSWKNTADRLAELEERVSAIDTWLRSLSDQYSGLSAAQSDHGVALARLTGRVGKLEPKPAEPARFVPTEPGWYWFQGDGYAPYPRMYDESVPQPSMGWLSPVAPCATPTRTEEEARREPRRGDRWQSPLNVVYTVRRIEGRRVVVSQSTEGRSAVDIVYDRSQIPEDGETYLGDFAHELEAP